VNRKLNYFILDHFELKPKRFKLFLLLLVPKFNTEVVKLQEEVSIPRIFALIKNFCKYHKKAFSCSIFNSML